jgi:hypothetical protein
MEAQMYSVVAVRDPDSLEEQVNAALEAGWDLWGFPTLTSGFYSQALIKKKPKSERKSWLDEEEEESAARLRRKRGSGRKMLVDHHQDQGD